MTKCFRMPIALAIGLATLVLSSCPLVSAHAEDIDFDVGPIINNAYESEPEFDAASGKAASSWRFSDGYYVGDAGNEDGIALYASSRNTWWKSGGTYCGSNGTTVWGAKGFGVDVSTHQGPIDWSKVKSSGVTFAIIRCGYGSDYAKQDDNQFLANVRGCQKYGIPFGVYLYSYAENTSMARSEASHVLRLLDAAGLSPVDLSYPVYYDLEEGGSSPNISNNQLLSNTKAFCSAISAAGFTPGVYANTNWWTHYLTSSEYDKWPRWVAQYNWQCTYGKHYDVWQADSQSSISGITGVVDVNFDFTGPLVHGDQWVYSNGSWWYRYKDGSYPKNGWAQIDGEWYYFDSSGWVQTGWVRSGGSWYYLSSSGAMTTGWQYVGGAWYYLEPGSGKMATGLKKVGGATYHLESSGAMTTGWALDGGKWYWSDSSGALETGWLSAGGSWYWLDKSTFQMATGWQQVDGKWYYLTGSGAMATGWLRSGGTWYYLDGSGAMAEGWKYVGGAWYYLEPVSGKMATGLKKVGGATYHLASSGAMTTGWALVGGKWYWSDSSGALETGWLSSGGSWYWLDKSTFRMATGWQQVDGKWYYLDGSRGGAMASSRWIGNYYVMGDGAMATSRWVGGYYVDANGLWDPTAVRK